MTKKEKYGIDELKQVVDVIAIGIKFFSGKMKLWQRIVMNFGGGQKLIAKLKRLIENRVELANEFKDLSILEIKEINRYAAKEHGFNPNFCDALEDMLNAIELFLQGLEKLKK